MAADKEQMPVIIYRLDDGGWRDRGHYLCSECSWEEKDKTRNAPQVHVKSAHRGRRQVLERTSPKTLKQDPDSIAKRKWAREHRARKKAAQERAECLSSDAVRWPLLVSPVAELKPCRAQLVPGSGRRFTAGNFDAEADESFQVAMTLAVANACTVGEWLGSPHEVQDMLGRSVDVSIVAYELATKFQESSGSAAGFLALAVLMGGRLKESKLAVTGEVDLRGRVLSVGDVREKIRNCMARGADLVIVPAVNLEKLEAEGWPSEEERAFVQARVRGVRNLASLLQQTLTDFRAPDVVAAARVIDGPDRVGVCCGMGLLDPQGSNNGRVCDYEVQCCRRAAGEMKVIVTGNVSDISKEAVESMRALVTSHLPIIVKQYGLALPPSSSRTKAAAPSLMRPRTDLHVHISHRWRPIKTSYQMAPVYLAMASLVIGRRPGDSVLAFGTVRSDGTLIANKWEVTKKNVEAWRMHGFRKAILGADVRVAEDAAAYAQQPNPTDQRPEVQIHIVGTILEALYLAIPRPQGS